MQSAQALTQIKACKRVCFFQPKKNKNSTPLKKNKTLPAHSPTDKNGMTELIEYYNGMSLDKKEGQLITAPTKNWRFGASYDSLVIQQTFVLRMNICGKNRQLLVAANR